MKQISKITKQAGRNSATIVGALSFLLIGVGTASAQFTPVDVTFGSNNDGFGSLSTAAQNTSNWTPETESIRMNHENGGVGSWDNMVANTEVSGISGEDFEMTAEMDVNGSVPSNASRWSLRFLQAGTDAAELHPQMAYQPEKNGGELSFTLSAGNGFGTVDDNIGLDVSSPWTFTLSGSYDGSGDLSLAGSVTDGSKNGSISGTIASGNVPSGEFMGFGARVSGAPFDTDVNSFSVVPEPGAVALLMGLGSLAFVAIRRRSR